MPVKDDDAPVTRAELRALLVEFADSIISHFDPRFQEINRRFDELNSQMAKLQSRMAELQSRLAEVENRLEKVEDRLKQVEAGQEKIVLTMFKAENRDAVRTALVEKMFEDQKKLNGSLILIQSEVAEFKSQYPMERVQTELEEMRRTTRRLEERVTRLEKNRAGASAA